ncbi:hypothetical protein C8Q79DRAFT_457247 [Trametes meyenii]|nr:hypothetical protein C8Q79DRAFT_457247 [Trametes meyenii]
MTRLLPTTALQRTPISTDIAGGWSTSWDRDHVHQSPVPVAGELNEHRRNATGGDDDAHGRLHGRRRVWPRLGSAPRAAPRPAFILAPPLAVAKRAFRRLTQLVGPACMRRGWWQPPHPQARWWS